MCVKLTSTRRCLALRGLSLASPSFKLSGLTLCLDVTQAHVFCSLGLYLDECWVRTLTEMPRSQGCFAYECASACAYYVELQPTTSYGLHIDVECAYIAADMA